jgi:hypothetical protein
MSAHLSVQRCLYICLYKSVSKSVRLYVCLYKSVYICLYKCVCTNVYIFLYKCVYTKVYLHLSVCTPVCTKVSVRLSVQKCLYICLYVCLYKRVCKKVSVHLSIQKYLFKTMNNSIKSITHLSTVNVENITVFLISLYSRFDNFPRKLNHREYSVIHYIYIFYLLFF